MALLAAIVLTLPLELSKTLFPIQQLEISRVLMIPALVAILVWIAEGARPIHRGFAIVLALVLGLNTVSFLMTRAPDGVLPTLAPLAYGAFAVFVGHVVRDRLALRVVALSILASGLYVAAIAIGQGLGGFYLWHEGLLDVLGRANATFADPNITARILAVAALVTLGTLVCRLRHGPADFALAVTLALLAAGMVVTQSRFGWVAMAVVLCIWLLITRRSARSWIATGLFVLAFAVTAFINQTAIQRAGEVASGVGFTLGGDVSSGQRGNLTAGDNQPYSPPRVVTGHQILERLPIDGVRFYLIEAGIAMWEDHPIAGVGTGGFSPAMLDGYRGFIPSDRLAAPVTLPHTFLIQVVAENGWLGLLVLGLLTFVIGRALVRVQSGSDRELRLAACVVGLSIAFLFLSSQAEGRLYVEPYFWLAVGLVVALEGMSKKLKSASPMQI